MATSKPVCVPTPSLPNQRLSREVILDRIAQLDHFGKPKIEDD